MINLPILNTTKQKFTPLNKFIDIDMFRGLNYFHTNQTKEDKMQRINTATLLKNRDLSVVTQTIDTTIRTRDNRKAYFQRKLQQLHNA